MKKNLLNLCWNQFLRFLLVGASQPWVFGDVLAAVWTFQVSICCIIYIFLLKALSWSYSCHALEIHCIIDGFCSLYILLVGHPPICFAHFWPVYQGSHDLFLAIPGFVFIKIAGIWAKMIFLLANPTWIVGSISLFMTGSSAAPFATTRPKVAISQQPTNEDRPKKWGVLGDFVFFFVNRGTKPTRICWRTIYISLRRKPLDSPLNQSLHKQIWSWDSKWVVDSQKRQIAPQAAAFQQTNMRTSIYPDLSMTHPFFTNYLSISFHIERVQLTHSLGVCGMFFVRHASQASEASGREDHRDRDRKEKKPARARCDRGGCIIIYYVCMTRNHLFF